MPGFIASKDAEIRRSLNDHFSQFSRTFILASTPATDILPLLARGERKQAALSIATAAKASQPGARQPLPSFKISSSDTKSLTTTPLLDERTLSTVVPRKSLRKTPSEPNIAFNDMSYDSQSPPFVVTKAGNKSFEMQIGEVDAAKAVNPSLLQPHSSVAMFAGDQQLSNHDYVSTETKRKAKSKNNKGYRPSDENDRNDFPHFPVHGKRSGDQKSNLNDEYRFRGKKPSKDVKTGGNSGGNWSSGKIWTSSGRGYRSNTFNDSDASQLGRRQDQNRFQSLRGDPRRRLWEEKTTPPYHAKNMQKAAFESSPRQLRHLNAPDMHGYNSPHGTWYPNASIQAQGLPPPFMPALGVPTPHLPVQPVAGGPVQPLETFLPAVLPSPFDSTDAIRNPSSRNGGAQHAEDPTLSQAFVQNTRVSKLHNAHPKSSSIGVKDAGSAVIYVREDISAQESMSDGPRPPIRVVASFTDPRTAHTRLESIMRTICGELDVLRNRITRGPEDKITDVDLIRYIDNCTSLCKHATAASNEIVMSSANRKENIDEPGQSRGEVTAVKPGCDGSSMGGQLHSSSQPHTNMEEETCAEGDVAENLCMSLRTFHKSYLHH